MRPISLHHIMAPELSPIALARLAGRLGCQQLCLFTAEPAPGFFVPTLRPADLTEMRACMAGEGLSLYGATSFAITAGGDPARYCPALDLAAALGARYASTRIADPDEDRAAQAFARLDELAASRGMRASIEFMALDEPEALERTLRIIAAAGRGALSIDPLHLFRSGAQLERLQGLDPGLFGYVQVCDGPATVSAEEYRAEAGADRLPPGAGVMPVAAYLRLAPANRPVSMEIPLERRRAAGEPAERRVGEALAATRRLLAGLDG